VDTTFEQIDHGKEQRTCLLLTERQSRYGDFASMIDIDRARSGKMCRVITWYISPFFNPFVTVDKAKNKVIEPSCKQMANFLRLEPGVIIQKQIALCSRELSQCKGYIFCLGEISNLAADALESVYARNLARVTLNKSRSLILLCKATAEVDHDTVWPGFYGESGPRFFVLPEEATPLSHLLFSLQKEIDQNLNRSTELWDQVQQMCLRRNGLEFLCEHAIVCILPDGPHFRQCAFHSSKLNLDDICPIICRTAEAYRFKCVVVENKEKEYLLLANAP